MTELTLDEKLQWLAEFFYDRPNAHLDPKWPKQCANIRSVNDQYLALKDRLTPQQIDARYVKLSALKRGK